MLAVGKKPLRADLSRAEPWDQSEEASPSRCLAALIVLLAIACACLPAAVCAIALSGMPIPSPIVLGLALFGTFLAGVKLASIVWVVIGAVGP